MCRQENSGARAEVTKKILKGSIRFARLVQMSNIFSACRVYYLSLVGRFETARVRINHCDLRIRLNSPDLGVALSNLGEEFSHLGKHLPEGFDGIIIMLAVTLELLPSNFLKCIHWQE